MTPDECFEFDYLMQIDQESREVAAREDSARDRGVSRDYWSSWGFYGSRKATKNSSLKINRWWIIFFIIVAILVIAYNIDEAHQKKRREEWRAKMAEIKAQELLEVETNSWYEEIPALDQEIVLNPKEIEEPKQEVNPWKSPYDGCSYVWEDNQWHPCPKQSVTVEEDVDSYVPIAQVPVAQVPVAQIPEAHIPEAHIPEA